VEQKDFLLKGDIDLLQIAGSQYYRLLLAVHVFKRFLKLFVRRSNEALSLRFPPRRQKVIDISEECTAFLFRVVV
jgi:hypothetical protein